MISQTDLERETRECDPSRHRTSLTLHLRGEHHKRASDAMPWILPNGTNDYLDGSFKRRWNARERALRVRLERMRAGFFN